MKRSWEIKQLGEVCNLTGGGTPSKKIEEYYDGNILWATVRDMNEDILYTTEHKITQIGLDNSSSNIIPKDNVIIATRVGLGKVCFLLNDTAINQDLKGIIPKNEDEIFNMFLFWWFKNISEQILKAGTGATVQGVKIPFIQSLQFPLPPLEEQKRIVAKLDECFEAIDKAHANVEKNLQNAKELFQSQLNQIFSQKGDDWVEKKLGDISDVTYGFTDKSFDTGDFRYVRITDIDDNGELTSAGKKYIKSSDDAKNFILKENDIVMARTGATFAKLLLYKDIEPSIFASYLIKVDFTEDIENELYWFYAKSNSYWNQANALSSGSAQPHFNGKALKQVLFSYPLSKSEQRRLIEKFRIIQSKTHSLESNYQQELHALDELKKSILQKAFNGEL